MCSALFLLCCHYKSQRNQSAEQRGAGLNLLTWLCWEGQCWLSSGPRPLYQCAPKEGHCCPTETAQQGPWGLAWEVIPVMQHPNKKASLSVKTHHEKKHTVRSFQYRYFLLFIKKFSEVEIQSNWKSLTTL